MSKNQASPSSGSGGTRGDVSFIRATHGTGPLASNIPTSSQSAEKLTTQQLNPTPTHPPRLPQDLPLQPHLYHHHHVRQPPQQHSHHQQYLPEHMETQQYLLKQTHGAGGASGDSGGRVSSHTGVEGWSEREEALVTELEEAKIRVAQMEKTMRWWSDCTSNWREKWNKARNERNKAREENRLLRAKLEAVVKELSRLKREMKEMPSDTASEENLGLHSSHSSISKSPEKLLELSEKEKAILAGTSEKECESLDDLSETSSLSSKPSQNHHDEKDVDDTEISTPRGSISGESCIMISQLLEKIKQFQEKKSVLEDELAKTQNKAAQAGETVVMMQRKLDEANNTIQGERLENCSHLKTIEKLHKQLEEYQLKLEEGNQSLQVTKLEKSTDSELSLDGLDKIKIQHDEELSRLTFDLEDEAASRTSMDKRMTELRRELERIQAENANEWAKTERLESDKLALERENKKLRIQVADLEEELQKRCQASSSVADSDLKTLEFELAEKNKELSDLRHLHTKMKKALAERTTELDHNRRRAEQYETEVRKLRSRVDELKKDLAAAEDEVDKQGNATRKAQRTNDELQAQVESLQVQVNHLQTRLRSSGKVGSVATPRSTSLKSLTLEDSAELADSENDFDDI